MKSSKMGAKSRPWALPDENEQRCKLASIYGDLSQSAKLSEVKPPLSVAALKIWIS